MYLLKQGIINSNSIDILKSYVKNAIANIKWGCPINLFNKKISDYSRIKMISDSIDWIPNKKIVELITKYTVCYALQFAFY